jgi:hypothetical protein
MLSDHKIIKLELNKRNNRKYLNICRLDSMLLCDHWLIKQIRNEIKNTLKFDENKSTTNMNLW